MATKVRVGESRRQQRQYTWALSGFKTGVKVMPDSGKDDVLMKQQ